MRIDRYCFVAACSIAIAYPSSPGHSGVLKSLDQELVALVAQTEPYLVTVTGQDGHRNLIATGIVYDTAGNVVTSAYACQADEFEIRFKSGKSYTAKKVGVDNLTGLAVLRMSGGPFSVPKWGETSKLREGAWITVVGNSYGVPATVNFGNLDGRTDDGLLQLSVNVSPGASGGAVLNIDGQVVGVLVAREAGLGLQTWSQDLFYVSLSNANTLRLLDGSVASTGRCYAVSIETIRRIADQLIQTGKVRRGFLGISPRNPTQAQKEKLGLESGAMVEEVDKGSPAEKAGFLNGDVIVAVNEIAIVNTGSLYAQIRSRGPGDAIVITYVRNDQRRKADVVLGEAKDESFMGGLWLSDNAPNAKTFNKLGIFDAGDLKTEMSQLKDQIRRLQDEIDQLKRTLKK